MSVYPVLDEVFPLDVEGRIRFFKLVRVGRHPDRAVLGAAIKRKGVPAPIGVRAAFMRKYPHTHKLPVGFAPAAWVNSMAGGGFPFIDCLGDARFEFFEAGSEFILHWLWLVEC